MLNKKSSKLKNNNPYNLALLIPFHMKFKLFFKNGIKTDNCE